MILPHLGASPRDFMCNWAQIWICYSHCMCNPFCFDLMQLFTAIYSYLQPKLLPFFGSWIAPLQTIGLSSGQSQKGWTYIDCTFKFKPTWTEISSVEALKGGKFTEDSCIIYVILFVGRNSSNSTCSYSWSWKAIGSWDLGRGRLEKMTLI